MANDTGDGDNTSPTDGDNDPRVETAPISLNAAFDVLAHHHRRELCRLLIEDEESTKAVSEITDHLCRQEVERTGEQPGQTQVEAALHHTHLPKMTGLGLVEYDPRSREIRYWPDERIETLLAVVDEEDLESIPEE